MARGRKAPSARPGSLCPPPRSPRAGPHPATSPRKCPASVTFSLRLEQGERLKGQGCGPADAVGGASGNS